MHSTHAAISRTFGVLLILLSCTFIFGMSAVAGAQQDASTLVVNGEAEVRVAPDMATFTVGVETIAETAEEARKDNAEKMSVIQERLLALGAPKRALQTTGIHMYPEWHVDQDDGSRTIVGYRFVNNLEVTVNDLSTLDILLDAALDQGGNQLSGPFFGLRQQDEVEEEVLRLAVERARKKAEVIAEATGVYLLGISHISEQVHLPMGRSNTQAFMAMDVSYAEQSATVAPGEITVTARVSITYNVSS